MSKAITLTPPPKIYFYAVEREIFTFISVLPSPPKKNVGTIN
jgi:hypothetical protein